MQCCQLILWTIVQYDPDIKKSVSIFKKYITVYLFDDTKCYAIFELGDQIKDSAYGAASDVKLLGVCPVMVSGDSEEVVSYVASQLDIKSYLGSCMPEDKAQYIKMLSYEGAVTAMIGDGVNDAPFTACSRCWYLTDWCY